MRDTLIKHLKDHPVAYIRQLYQYCVERDRTGYYYGNKKQFEKRHDYLLRYLEAILDQAEEDRRSKNGQD